MREKKLDKPFYDFDREVHHNSFREYADYMMWPEPTRVELSTETANIATDAINKHGLDIYKVFNQLIEKASDGSDYQYDDAGRECLKMKNPEGAKATIAKMVQEKTAAQAPKKSIVEQIKSLREKQKAPEKQQDKPLEKSRGKDDYIR